MSRVSLSFSNNLKPPHKSKDVTLNQHLENGLRPTFFTISLISIIENLPGSIKSICNLEPPTYTLGASVLLYALCPQIPP
ncbi:hypothetical protein LguiA_011970 [Lonicera macranthoides]